MMANVCSACGEQGLTPRYINEKTVAYQCNNCGWDAGEYSRDDFSTVMTMGSYRHEPKTPPPIPLQRSPNWG